MCTYLSKRNNITKVLTNNTTKGKLRVRHSHVYIMHFIRRIQEFATVHVGAAQRKLSKKYGVNLTTISCSGLRYYKGQHAPK